jgi:hypothetical protein
MSSSRDISRLFWPLFLVGIIAVSIWAAPFDYDHGNSGRYLLVVAKRMDPALFPGDPVVAAMARFDSLFYRVLPAVLSGPERFEGDLFKVFIGMKIALMLSLFWLIRTLTKEPLAAVLLLAWCSQSTSGILGGIPLFANMVTHNEIALVLGILAIVCAVRRLYWGFWPLVCLALFIHSLVTIHLLACVLPVLLLSERQKRVKFLLGAAGFCVCFLSYMHWMTPPPMSSEEASIFMAAKGKMQHISPLVQGAADYLKFGLLLALAVLGQRRWLSAQPASKLIIHFAICGTIIAFLLSFVAVFGGFLSITQMQPMRIFFWVTLFLQVIIAWAACAAFNERHPVAWALLGVIIFGMADSLWAQGLAVLTIAGFGFDWISQRPWKNKELARWSGWLLWAFALAVIACALSGNRGPLRSLRDPWLLMLGAGLPMVIKISELKRAMTVSLVVGLCLCSAAVGAHHAWETAQEKSLKSSRNDWLVVCDWCRKNSAKADLFLTPPTGDNFRLHALRSSVGEEMSALAWVDPKAYKTNLDVAAAVKKDFQNGSWDLDGLRSLSRIHGARFVVVDGPFRPAHQAVFSAGGFSIHEVGD